MELITDAIKDFVNQQKLGFAATVCPDGSPNLSPKGTTKVWDAQHLVFADIHSPGTVNNLLLNPAIEINVVDVFTRKGYRFKGTGEVLSEGPIFKEIVASYGEAGAKYTIKHIILVSIDRIRQVISPVYDTGTSEEEVKKKWKGYWESLNE